LWFVGGGLLSVLFGSIAFLVVVWFLGLVLVLFHRATWFGGKSLHRSSHPVRYWLSVFALAVVGAIWILALFDQAA